MKLRVGVIGIGEHWQSSHGPALRALADRFEVRAVCDAVSARAARVASEFAARQVDGFRNLVSLPDIDAVLLLSGDWFEELPIVACCDVQRAVYCSAALRLSPRRAAQLHRRVRDAGIAFVAEFPYRCAPASLRLQELIATRLGRPRSIDIRLRRTAGTHDGDVAAAMRGLLERIDWCRFIAGGEPASVAASATTWPAKASTATDGHRGTAAKRKRGALPINEPAMEIAVELELIAKEAPVAVRMQVSEVWQPAWREALRYRVPAEMQVMCERGVAFVDLPASLVWFDEAGQHTESLGADRPTGEQLLLQFHRAVTSLVLNQTSVEDAYRSLIVIDRALESIAIGQRLPICTDLP